MPTTTPPKKKVARKRPPGVEQILLCVDVPPNYSVTHVFRAPLGEDPDAFVAYAKEYQVWAWRGKPVTKADYEGKINADPRFRNALVRAVYGTMKLSPRAFLWAQLVRVEPDYAALAVERASTQVDL